jgi:hypothetical protein
MTLIDGELTRAASWQFKTDGISLSVSARWARTPPPARRAWACGPNM